MCPRHRIIHKRLYRSKGCRRGTDQNLTLAGQIITPSWKIKVNKIMHIKTHHPPRRLTLRRPACSAIRMRGNKLASPQTPDGHDIIIHGETLFRNDLQSKVRSRDVLLRTVLCTLPSQACHREPPKLAGRGPGAGPGAASGNLSHTYNLATGWIRNSLGSHAR